jgi:hypothetical protein
LLNEKENVKEEYRENDIWDIYRKQKEKWKKQIQLYKQSKDKDGHYCIKVGWRHGLSGRAIV